MIEKIIFRDSVKDFIIMYLVTGRIKPGQRLSLPKLSSELDVSVTPIREALTQLTETGMVNYLANRGFFVADIDEKEANELYDLIILLECEGIKDLHFDNEDIRVLRMINDRFNHAESNLERSRLDQLFHTQLLSNYTNKSLKKLIENIRTRIAIYEQKYMDFSPARASYEHHKKIINALAANNMPAALDQLKANWQVSIDFITDPQ